MEYPMSNIQHSISLYLYLYPQPFGNWLFLVGYWILSVGCWLLGVDNALFYTFVMLSEHSMTTLGYRERKLI